MRGFKVYPLVGGHIIEPKLIIITGRPGAGKTTLAKVLGPMLHLPVISRDEIKEGLLCTLGKSHSELPPDINRTATGIFSSAVGGLLERGVSVIAEAAFRRQVWLDILSRFKGTPRTTVLICHAGYETLADRINIRLKSDPSREYFHGERPADARDKRSSPPDEHAGPYPNARVIRIDTADGYSPSLSEIVEEIDSDKTG